MKIAPLNLNNVRQGVIFKGKTPNVDDLIASRRFANCALDGLWDDLAKRNARILLKILAALNMFQMTRF